jgi:hypothetical protein
LSSIYLKPEALACIRCSCRLLFPLLHSLKPWSSCPCCLAKARDAHLPACLLACTHAHHQIVSPCLACWAAVSDTQSLPRTDMSADGGAIKMGNESCHADRHTDASTSLLMVRYAFLSMRSSFVCQHCRWFVAIGQVTLHCIVVEAAQKSGKRISPAQRHGDGLLIGTEDDMRCFIGNQCFSSCITLCCIAVVSSDDGPSELARLPRQYLLNSDCDCDCTRMFQVVSASERCACPRAPAAFSSFRSRFRVTRHLVNCDSPFHANGHAHHQLTMMA